MRKNILSLFLALILCLSLAACGASQESSPPEGNQDLPEETTPAEDSGEPSQEDSTTAENQDLPEETPEAGDSPEPAQEVPSGPSYQITYQDYTLYTDSQGQVRDYVLVEVENTGTANLWLQDAYFSFTDENGNLVGMSSDSASADPSIIAPGERGYFYSNMSAVDGEVTVDGDYTLVPELMLAESEEEIVRYEVSDTSIFAGTSGPLAVTGNVTNTTDEDASSVWVATIFFDENDTPLCAAGIKVMDLAAGSTQPFSLDAMLLADLDVSIDDVARYQVYACKP